MHVRKTKNAGKLCKTQESVKRMSKLQQLIVVESVERMSKLQQHIVGSWSLDHI